WVRRHILFQQVDRHVLFAGENAHVCLIRQQSLLSIDFVCDILTRSSENTAGAVQLSRPRERASHENATLRHDKGALRGWRHAVEQREQPPRPIGVSRYRRRHQEPELTVRETKVSREAPRTFPAPT